MSLTIGVDIGGTNLVGALVTEDGEIRARTRRDTPAHDVPGISVAVTEVVRELLGVASRQGGPDPEVVGVGLACAGYVDATRSTVLFAPNLAWRDVELRGPFEAELGLPVVVENDANAAAWGEFRFGAGAEHADMLLITIGTGVGGGVVTNGRVLRGAHGVATEIGHLRVVPGGHPCGCGNRGCLEQYASGNALVREGQQLVRSRSPRAAALDDVCGGDPDALTGQMITALAEQGDAAAVELLHDLGTWLGEGAASLAAVLDPGLVVVGGGVSAAGDLLVAPATAAFHDQLAGRGHRPEAPVTVARLGNEAGVIGVADLARAPAARPDPDVAPGGS